MSYDNYAPVEIGFISIIPPVVAMGLALATKEVVSSLLLGSVAASIIYSVAVLRGMVSGLSKANPVDVLFTVMGTKISNNVHICLFLLLMGGLINLISASGGSRAYGKMAQRVVKGKRPALFSTLFLGIVMFLDEYFNAITTGTVMRSVAEVNKVSRPKLAYIVHTVATNMCITIPLTSWAAAIVSQIKDSGVEDSFMVFLRTIPYNIYSFLSFIMIILTSVFDFDYGKMKFYEDNAKLGLTETNETLPATKTATDTAMETASPEVRQSEKGTMWDLLLPIFVMVVLAVYFMFSIGRKASNNSSDITVILGATSAPKALLFACFVALVTTLVMYVPRKLMSFSEWINNLIEGMKSMVSTLIILVLAWCISGCSGDLLQTGAYVGYLVRSSPIPPQMIPAVVFLVGMALSFATGTAWGTFSLLIPIAVSICSGDNRVYLIPSISSCLCGAVFGNNTSPISDTTALVSSAIQCPFLMHVSTQLPYAATVAAVSIVGYLVAGYTQGNLGVTLGVSFVLLVVVLFCIHAWQKNHTVKEHNTMGVDEKKEIEMQELKITDEKSNENDLDEVVVNVGTIPDNNSEYLK